MKFFAAAALAAVGVASAHEAAGMFDKKFMLPAGLALPSASQDLPHAAPEPGLLDTWHPPHPGVLVDGCDSLKLDAWHWVHPAKPAPPIAVKLGWTTSTVTLTSTKTVISCAPTVKVCPTKGGTTWTTVTVTSTTTICPVPVATPPPPPVITIIPPAPVTTPIIIPPVTTPVVVPPKPVTTPVIPPATVVIPPVTSPATTPSPIISTIGTVTKPSPTVTTPRVIVTAAANPNVQRAGGALVAVAVAAVALI
jgi:hypothetical protein